MCCRSEWQERMFIYKWHEVDQTKHEIFCVHIVCNEIQVKVNLEITTFFFYLRFPYCPQLFLIWGCISHAHSLGNSEYSLNCNSYSHAPSCITLAPSLMHYSCWMRFCTAEGACVSLTFHYRWPSHFHYPLDRKMNYRCDDACAQRPGETQKEWECKTVTDRNIHTAGSDIRSSNAALLSMFCPILILKESSHSAYCCYGYVLCTIH